MTRVYLTGGAGFVGSNIVEAFRDAGDHVHAAVHRTPVSTASTSTRVDLLDPTAVVDDVTAAAPDVVVHAAIRNDLVGLATDRRGAWRDFVDATRNVVDAANRVDARVILVSTDWVFDGRGHQVAEDEPPHPVNSYGLLKLLQERVVLERAARATVVRISAVNGEHRQGRATVRQQDVGFGYLVGSLVDALEAGDTFTLWDAPDINTVATLSLASDVAARIRRIAELDLDGVLHGCGAEPVERRVLATLTCEVFGLDPELIRVGPPPSSAMPDEPVPRDTSLDAAVSAQRLGMPALTTRELLSRFASERAASPGSR